MNRASPRLVPTKLDMHFALYIKYLSKIAKILDKDELILYTYYIKCHSYPLTGVFWLILLKFLGIIRVDELKEIIRL